LVRVQTWRRAAAQATSLSSCRPRTIRIERRSAVATTPCSDLSLTVPRYTNGRASDLNSLQEIIHVSRLSFFTHSLTRSFFVSSLKERNYTYSMYLSTVKVGTEPLRGVITRGSTMMLHDCPAR